MASDEVSQESEVQNGQQHTSTEGCDQNLESRIAARLTAFDVQLKNSLSDVNAVPVELKSIRASYEKLEESSASHADLKTLSEKLESIKASHEQLQECSPLARN